VSEMQLSVRSFIELLETIADNKYVLGDRLVEIGVSGPNLEATLAAIAMAQGELGHARLLYNWCFDLRNMKGKKAEIHGQTGKAFRGVVNVHNWISLIAVLYTVNTAINIVLQSALESCHSKVASRIQKLIREQQDHIIYAKNWAEQLCRDQGAVPHRFRESLKEIIDEVYAWLAEIEKNQELQAEGYLPKNVKLTEKFKEQLKELNTEHLVHMK
jgi:ring-1,2-phenylacetyl-CoA epoxidase subunit PaaC